MVTKNLTATDTAQSYDLPQKCKSVMVHNLSGDNDLIFRMDANPTADFKTVPAGKSVSWQFDGDNKIHYQRAGDAVANVLFDLSWTL